MAKPLPPIDVPWTMKALASARIESERFADARLRLSIRHDVLKGVTPKMLVWWFNNMDGVYKLGDREWPRYRVWHPRDHVKLTYLRPAQDKTKFGKGAQIRIQEIFNGNPAYSVDVVDDVDFLDETGFRHRARRFGRTAMVLEYKFTPTADGTLYENSMTIGIEGARAFNRYIRPLLASDKMAEAWLLHNIEEVGNFEHFLPRLHGLVIDVDANSRTKHGEH